jgi:hypothetical protein
MIDLKERRHQLLKLLGTSFLSFRAFLAPLGKPRAKPCPRQREGAAD